ncbi:serpin family protein [Piscibacillus halophilus]|uniref:Serpin B n=1 Tax=Piscibacillus halophilus TaxID=571933 RepID=A0A1H9IUW0_9BACI|nr:serpin family protein [Piscibacillus halophilus]SEQ78364.1 serpin B [Piscibacillus halophilus]
MDLKQLFAEQIFTQVSDNLSITKIKQLIEKPKLEDHGDLAFLNDIDLNIANSIWLRDGLQVKDEFKEANEIVFDSEVFERDFSDDTMNEINGWVENETEGLIEKILNEPIPGNVQMYLINAIYFKGEWSKQFKEERTEQREFIVNNESIHLPMMQKEETVQYGEGDDYQLVEMEYAGGSTSMYVVLPSEETPLSSFIENLDHQNWKQMINDTEEVEDLMISMPKFDVEYGVKDISNDLKELGMISAFNDADFSGISNSGLRLNRVLHKAIIEVDEQGSEAAAVTAVEVEESAKEIKSFNANRPFLYAIVDNELDSILFMGTYYGDKKA